MLTIDDLTVLYRTPNGTIEALTSVSLFAAKGSTLALVGESGSGKSTIALAAMGLLPAEAKIASGRILLDRDDILAMTDAQRRRLRGTRVSLVFQDPFSVLNPSLRIGDQVGEGLIYHRGFSRGEARARAVELLDEVGIANPAAVARAYPHELSGGMRQRALIAGALASEPELLILDEPTTALDVTIEAQILALLETLRAKESEVGHHIPTVAISALSDPEIQRRAAEEGFDAYFVKPCDFQEVFGTLARLANPGSKSRRTSSRTSRVG